MSTVNQPPANLQVLNWYPAGQLPPAGWKATGVTREYPDFQGIPVRWQQVEWIGTEPGAGPGANS